MVLTNSWTWKDWATPFGQNIWKVSEYQLSIQRFVVFYLDCRPPNERCPSSLLCPISRPKLARDATQLLMWNKSHKNHRKKISSYLKKSELENFNDRHRQRDFASREKKLQSDCFRWNLFSWNSQFHRSFLKPLIRVKRFPWLSDLTQLVFPVTAVEFFFYSDWFIAAIFQGVVVASTRQQQRLLAVDRFSDCAAVDLR